MKIWSLNVTYLGWFGENGWSIFADIRKFEWLILGNFCSTEIKALAWLILSRGSNNTLFTSRPKEFKDFWDIVQQTNKYEGI